VGALKTGVEVGAALAQKRDRALDLFFPVEDVGIDLMLMAERVLSPPAGG